MPLFRGGGSAESSVFGRYADAVTILRLDDSRMLIEDVKWRLARGHDCECREREAANLERAPDEVIGAIQRWTDILKGERVSQSRADRQVDWKQELIRRRIVRVEGVTNMILTG